ncbi:hypothetical protein [Nocardia farcinica]|uniref:hypothetical protein n=1 Tax=Nocardia farcinica TaxID=37329 RepID=UPI002458C5DC|nr:hypothetical protein [Nocardia farcinica]
MDTPALLPGVEQDNIRVIKRGRRLLLNLDDATVPPINSAPGATPAPGCTSDSPR